MLQNRSEEPEMDGWARAAALPQKGRGCRPPAALRGRNLTVPPSASLFPWVPFAALYWTRGGKTVGLAPLSPLTPRGACRPLGPPLPSVGLWGDFGARLM